MAGIDDENPQVENIIQPDPPVRLILGEGVGVNMKTAVDFRVLLHYADKSKDTFEVSQLYPVDMMPELVGRDDTVVYEGEEFTVLGAEIIQVFRSKTPDDLPAQVLTILVQAVRK
jgi:hypothetical protein